MGDFNTPGIELSQEDEDDYKNTSYFTLEVAENVCASMAFLGVFYFNSIRNVNDKILDLVVLQH